MHCSQLFKLALYQLPSAHHDHAAGHTLSGQARLSTVANPVGAEFHFRTFTVQTLAFSLLAGAHVGAILILDSNLLGFKSLTANFSLEFKKKVKVYALATLIIQNAPQLVVQM